MGKTKTAFIGETSDEPKGKKLKDKKPDKFRTPGSKGGERVKVVESDMPLIMSEALSGSSQKISSKRKVHKRGKKYTESRSKVDRSKLYPLDEAIKLIKETSYSKFDGSVELHIVVRKEGLSAKAALPHSTGKSKKIEIADEKTIKKLETGKVDFDVLLSTPDMMSKLVPFAKILGPKGLMPNPKNGTIIKSADDAKKFSVDTLQIKTEKKAPLIHLAIGKVSMDESKLKENTVAVFSAISTNQIVKVYIKSSMSPSIKVRVDN